jgi:hypothetical protein
VTHHLQSNWHFMTKNAARRHVYRRINSAAELTLIKHVWGTGLRKIKYWFYYSFSDLPDDCFKYIPKFYPFLPYGRRTDYFFIGSGISMTATKCKLGCLHWRGKICNSVFHHSLYDNSGRPQFYTCWGFEEDKRDNHSYREYELLHARYFVRTCAP